MQYKKLTPTEEQLFRQWARDNYVPDTNICGVWHPVLQDECVKINAETSNFVEESGEHE